MGKTKYMCENCGKYEAVAKDYRWYDDEGIERIVCEYCFNLNDYWFDRVHKERLDPKKVLEGKPIEECRVEGKGKNQSSEVNKAKSRKKLKSTM